MRKYYGRVSLERLYINTPNERWAYMLAETGACKQRELRTRSEPVLRNADNSVFRKYIGREVEVTGQPYTADVIMVSDIKLRK